MDTTEIIHDGQSQAVKLPEGYRFEGTAVSIRREGEAVILEPLKTRQWPAGFFEQILVDDPAFRRPDQGSMPPAPKFDAG